MDFRVNSEFKGSMFKNDTNLAKYRPILIKFVSNDRKDDGQIHNKEKVMEKRTSSLVHGIME